jgi:hypothetical protein
VRSGHDGRKAFVETAGWEGPKLQTCMNAASVVRAFPETSRRREVLTFNHHAEVAALPPEEADALRVVQVMVSTGRQKATETKCDDL